MFPQSSERSLDDLRPALVAWSLEAIETIGEYPYGFIDAIELDKWRLDNSGYYRRTEESKFIWRPEGMRQLKDLPSYEALYEAAKSSHLIGPLLYRMIGTPLGVSRFDFWEFASAILPTPEEYLDDEFPTFELRYDRLTEQFASVAAEYEVTYFLQGVSFAQERIELEPDLVIERIRSEEVENALLHGIFTPTFGSASLFKLHEGMSFKLKRTWRLPRIFEEEMSSEPSKQTAELRDPDRKSEELIQCLALLSNLSVYTTGRVISRIDNDFSMIAKLELKKLLPVPRSFEGEGFKLNKNQCLELRQVWRLSHDDSFPQNKAVALAVRRLGFATQRDRPEDRLIDVMIAAEAFYLADAGDAKERTDLKYRLALRAAVWSEGTLDGWTRRQVYRQMRRGYDARSAVAHGGELKAKEIKVREQQANLTDLVDSIENIVRAALKKAFGQTLIAGRHLVIDWDSLILPEEDER